jgi:hypothetical protein
MRTYTKPTTTTKRWISPTPNCGHGGTTFTWVAIAFVWMCPACIASIGALYQTCTKCGRTPLPGTQLVDVFRAGRLCHSCRRDHNAARRIRL